MKQIVLAIISKIEDEEIKYLLCNSVLDFGQYTGFFYPPAGTMSSNDKSESEFLIAKVKLETGLNIIPLEKLDQTPADIPNAICNWWKCDTKDYSLQINNACLKDAIWLTPNEIERGNDVWPATKKFFRRLC